MRIARFIAANGICSRRQAEKLIEQGRVSIDDKIITSPAFNISDTNVVKVNNEVLTHVPKPKLWLYYKPMGLITTHDDPQGRKTVFQEIGNKLPRVISIGRLDINSEGLLLLTNSGEVARYFESPKNKIERIYKVRAFGRAKPVSLNNKPIVIEGVKYHPKLIRQIQKGSTNSWYEVVLTEGKNREIRKIFEHFGFEINRLIRIGFGAYSLDDLKPGEFKEMVLDENYCRKI
jgi:23S rRNA pseudouridine2605 synthase